MSFRVAILLSISIAFLGCVPRKQPITLVPVSQPAVASSSSIDDTAAAPLPSSAEFSSDNSPDIQKAMEQFIESGKAPIIKRAGFVQYPFGEVQPVLNCQQDYGCDIELQPGESVKAVILGNEPLWDYLVWESDQQYKATPHVTIGPRSPQTRTNAIIGTDRRTYHLELLSTNKAEYVRSAKFYYPRERLREFQQRRDKSKRVTDNKERTAASAADQSRLLPYQYISFGWAIDADSGATWVPSRVYDDGAHIYIQFPSNVSFEDLPGIFVPTADGELSQPVWRTGRPEDGKSRETGSYIMVDGMFDELQLIGGFNRSDEKVVIRKKR